jgi:hypothetical protein
MKQLMNCYGSTPIAKAIKITVSLEDNHFLLKEC